MGYCDGMGHRRPGGGYGDGLGQIAQAIRVAQGSAGRPQRTDRQRLRGARRRAKRAVVMQRTPVGRAAFRGLQEKVRRGTASRKERRLVEAIIPTAATVQAIEKKGGLDPRRDEQMRKLREDAARAAEDAAEARAAAMADAERIREEAEAARQQRALDAQAERERRAADADAERQIRADQRREAQELADEERRLAIEQADFEREMIERARIDGIDYVPAPPPASVLIRGGGGGGLPSWRTNGEVTNGAPAPARGGGALLPLAAGAALLFLGGV